MKYWFESKLSYYSSLKLSLDQLKYFANKKPGKKKILH